MKRASSKMTVKELTDTLRMEREAFVNLTRMSKDNYNSGDPKWGRAYQLAADVARKSVQTLEREIAKRARK